MAKYVLKVPVGDKTEVTVKEEWEAGDFIDVQNAGDKKGDQLAQQIALAIDWPVPLVRKLSIPDYMAIMELSNRFFSAKMTGKK